MVRRASSSVLSVDVRLKGTIEKKNTGFLRPWRSRLMVITSDGFLQYPKKNSVRVKEVDLIQAEISKKIVLHGDRFCIDIRCGHTIHFLLGFTTSMEAKRWLDHLVDAAEENINGRREWIVTMRNVLILPLQDRWQVVEHMEDRDWGTEWNDAWWAWKRSRGETFYSRRRRLQQLYRIWLHFQVFAQLIAEIYVMTDQNLHQDKSHDMDDPSKEEIDADVDIYILQLRTIQFSFGSHSWRGHKRLSKEIKALSQFQQVIELLIEETNEDGEIERAMQQLPVFPLMATFSFGGLQVVASAHTLREHGIPMDRHDLGLLKTALQRLDGVRYLPFRELPTLWVRKLEKEKGPGDTLVRVTSRYDDVFVNSMRSQLVYGVLLQSTGAIEVLTAHDVKEYVDGKTFKRLPYLDLHYYSLDENHTNTGFEQFTLQSDLFPHGDVVITIDAKQSRLDLNLLETFVTKFQVDILPYIRRLEEIKISSINKALIHSKSGVVDVATDIEQNIKRLLRVHIQEVAVNLVTLGDEPLTISACDNEKASRRTKSDHALTRQSMPDLWHENPNDNQSKLDDVEPLRPERSSMNSFQPGVSRAGYWEDDGTSGITTGLYIIDSLHLGQVLKTKGISFRFLPQLYVSLSSKRQPGVQLLVACEIIARIAKSLFRFRLVQMKRTWQNSDDQTSKRKTLLIAFIQSIMQGLGDENNQFWHIDAVIWYLLGPFSSSFTLNDVSTTRFQEMSTPLFIKRLHIQLQTNPSILFNHLLHVFQVYLRDTYMSTIDETRFLSLPFLTVDQVESIGQSPLEIQCDWLTTQLQFFRTQFYILEEQWVEGEDSNERSGDYDGFYKRLTMQFRLRLQFSSILQVENLISTIETQRQVRIEVYEAFQAVCESRVAVAKLACDRAYELMNKLNFLSVQECLAVFILKRWCERRALSSTSFQVSEWQQVLEWLYYFYRPARNTQTLSITCPHPLSDALFSMSGTSGCCPQRLAVPIQGEDLTSNSLRMQIATQQAHELWMPLRGMLERSYTRAGNTMCDRLRSFCNDMKRYKPSTIKKAGQNVPATSSVLCRDRVLQLVEMFLLNNDSSMSKRIPTSWIGSSSKRYPPLHNNRVSMPGMAMIWGKPTGLSLDEESKLGLSNTESPIRLATHPVAATDVSILHLPLPVRRIEYVSCGYRHTALITAQRELFTFGYGECGRLGHGDEESLDIPKRVESFSDAHIRQVSCGREHTMVVLETDELFGFGWAEAGRLGTGESGSILLPNKVISLHDVRNVACGREHTLALTNLGEVYAFGAGFNGRLGNGKEDDEEFPVNVSALCGHVIVAIDAGECHSCVVSQEGRVFAWGFGSSGALGHGTMENELTPIEVHGPWNHMKDRVISIACGSYHTLARTQQGRVYGWGDTAAGQLGEDLLQRHDDFIVLSPQEIQLLTTHRVVQIACGTFTTAALTDHGELFMWGSSLAGNGAKLQADDARVQHVQILSEFEIGDVSCGAYHTVVLTKDCILS